MAVTEQQRHQLYNHLEQLLGTEDATVLMQHLHPGGYDAIATKGDLVAFEQRVELRFQVIDHRLDALEHKLDGRLDALEHKLDGRIDALEHKVEGRLERVQRELTVRTVTVMVALLTMQTAVLGLLRAG